MLKCEYIIVGGGIQGLSTAFHLAANKRGGEDICLFEKEFIGYGDSGRNLGRFRVHFGAEENLRFALKAIDYLVNLHKLLGYNTLVARTGYLWLIYDEEEYKVMKRHLPLFEKYKIPLIEYSPDETYKRFSYLRRQKDLIASFLGPQDGTFHPDAIVFGFWKRLLNMNVKIYEWSEVKEIIVRDGNVSGVRLVDGREFNAKTVVLAVGKDLKYFSEKMNLGLSIEPVRKEVMVTEPFKYHIKELVIDSKFHTDFSQTFKGEIIGSAVVGEEVKGLVKRENTFRWLRSMAYILRNVLKGADKIRIMRIWSGFYDMTPDRSHIMGRKRDWPHGLYVIGGFSGHGFMLGPYAGKLLAEYILTGEEHELMKPFTPERFERKKIIYETFVIG